MHGSLRHGAPYLRATAMALVLLATSSAAFAQVGQMYGEIVGKVSDPQGGVLPGVTVTLSGPSVMGTPTAVTNEQGNYRFPAAPSGTHRLTFEMAGFTTLVRDDLFVPVRTTVTVNVTLRLATLAETVTVKGESALVDVQNTKLGERLDRQVLEAVPTQRTIFGAATTLPGMVWGARTPAACTARRRRESWRTVTPSTTSTTSV